MWNIIKAIGKWLYDFFNSPWGRDANFTFGRAAAVGGFILSLHIFLKQIKNPIAKFIASIATAIAMLILAVNNYVKTQFYNRLSKQLIKNQEIFEKEARILLLEATLPNQYHQLMQSLDVMNYTSEEVLFAAIHHHVNHNSFSYRSIKYVTSFVDMCFAIVAMASALYINFTVPAVLMGEIDNERLRLAANVLASVAAVYAIFSSLANSHQMWDELDKQSDIATIALDKLTHAQRHFPSVYSDRIKNDLTIWADRRGEQVAEQVAVPRAAV